MDFAHSERLETVNERTASLFLFRRELYMFVNTVKTFDMFFIF